MTPVFPAFTGFVPANITRVLPNATVVRGSDWNGLGSTYSRDMFLEPFDPLFSQLQRKLIEIQKEIYGNVSNVYTLDQYNENTPYSGDVGYLRNISRDTMASLRNADPDAIWLMQAIISYTRVKLGVAILRSTIVLDERSDRSVSWGSRGSR